MDSNYNSEGVAKKLMSFISNRMPYSTQDIINTIQTSNPRYKEFYELSSKREELLNKHSIANNPFFNQAEGVHTNQDFYQFMYANIDPDKVKRLRDYRLMASTDIISDCLDEICDECIVVDDKGDIVTCEIDNPNMEKVAKEQIEKEFDRIVRYFELEEKGWEHFRNILVDGELYFENIISDKHPNKGILGIVSVPTESIDPIFNNVQNMLIKSYLLRKQIIDPDTRQVTGIQPIIFDKDQITYFNSGIWNDKKTFMVPFIETARRAFKSLTMIEDSIIIHRIVNAPEKLVFNVDVGNLPNPQIQSHLNRLAQKLWTKKTYDRRQGAVNMFNPQSMIDAFWFPKRAGSEGTTMTRQGGTQNLGDLPDLDHFIQKVYKAMHVPISRLSSDTSFSDGTDILREELRFAKFIIRLQRQFSTGLKNTFIAHLKLKQYWEQYNLKENDIVIKFNPPTHFHLLREQQIKELKYNNYSALASDEAISKTFLMKKELGWTDQEILANRKFAEKDAAYYWKLQQILEYGPDWEKLAEREAKEAAQSFDDGGGLSMGSELGDGGDVDIGGDENPESGESGGAETPPDFGGQPDTEPQETQT